MNNRDEFTVPSEPGSVPSKELIGELVLIRPVEPEKTIETTAGSNLARFSECLIVVDGNAEPAPKYRNLGVLPIFWQVVRRQLEEARPWLAGTIVHSDEGRGFYRVQAPEPDQLDGLRRVLKLHADDPIPVEKPETDQSDESPY